MGFSSVTVVTENKFIFLIFLSDYCTELWLSFILDDVKGNFKWIWLTGSSRQFAGFDFSLQYDVMEKILKKAAEYLPALGDTHLAEALNAGTVRVGHRPYGMVIKLRLFPLSFS